MSALEATVAVLAAVLGGFLASFISARQERWKFRQERAAVKEDRQAEREDKLEEIQSLLTDLTSKMAAKQQETEATLARMQQVDEGQTNALQLLLLDRILHLGQAYIERGWVTVEEKNNIKSLYKCYHNELGGNGNADTIKDAVDRLDYGPPHERQE